MSFYRFSDLPADIFEVDGVASELLPVFASLTFRNRLS